MNEKDRHISIVFNGKETFIPLNEDNKNRKPIENTDEEDFHWVLPKKRDTEPVLPSAPKLKKKRFFKRKKRKKKRFHLRTDQRSVLKKVWLSIVSAGFIGTSFGVAILMMFAGDNVLSQDANSDGQALETEAVDDAEQGADLNLSLAVIQAGAFETKEAAKKAVEQLRDKGYAAVIAESVQPVRVYVGLSENNDGAETIAKSHQDTYIKTVSIKPSQSFAETTAELLSEGKQVFTALVREATAQFKGQEPKPERREKYKSWQEKWREREEAIPASHKQALADFTEQLQEADQALNTYAQEKNEAALWDAEQALLSAYLQYHQLLADEG